MSEEAKKHVHVIKRNGEEVTFDLSKIENAILAASNEVDNLHQLNEYQVHAIADNLEKQIESMSHAVHVEDIQDMVETGIMEMRGYEVAQKYVRYRYKRELARKSNTTDNGILALIDHMNEEVNQENSNKNPVINSTQRDYMVRFPRISQRECCCRRISWKHTRPESYISTIQITMHRRSITVTSSISRTCCRMEPSSARL